MQNTTIGIHIHVISTMHMCNYTQNIVYVQNANTFLPAPRQDLPFSVLLCAVIVK